MNTDIFSRILELSQAVLNIVFIYYLRAINVKNESYKTLITDNQAKDQLLKDKEAAMEELNLKYNLLLGEYKKVEGQNLAYRKFHGHEIDYSNTGDLTTNETPVA